MGRFFCDELPARALVDLAGPWRGSTSVRGGTDNGFPAGASVWVIDATHGGGAGGFMEYRAVLRAAG